MTFAEKLSFLMDITRTSNSELARHAALDASYVSRLRTGKRLQPKDNRIIESMAAFLARRFKEDYQKKALFDRLKQIAMPDGDDALADDIALWLMQSSDSGAQQVELFLSSLSGMSGRSDSPVPSGNVRPYFPQGAMSIYYGVEGKRRAVEYFLSEAAACEKPQTLLLFSDEETSWMREDPAYACRWSELMFRILARGNRIKIVHTLNRDLDEMLCTIYQWMPLYMTGSIEPYFYPKKRDGVFRRTLFIAPETAAVISNSVGEQPATGANILFRERKAVASFTEEFMQFLRLCRPLMRVFTAKDGEECFNTLDEFERGRADTLIKTESLSLLTMPEPIFRQILRRSGLDITLGIANYQKRQARFQENLKLSRFAELISLPDAQAVRRGNVKVSMSDMLRGGAVYYTPEEYIGHLEHVVKLLETCENYHVHLIEGPTDDRYTVYAREEWGVIVAKTSQPPVVLAVSEGNLTAAYWDFLVDMIEGNTYKAASRSDLIGRLRAYLAGISEK